MSSERSVFWLLLAIGLFASLYAATLRHRAEQANATVELGVEYADARKLALLANAEVADVLSQLRSAGVTTLIVYEDTVRSLRDGGAAHFLRVRRHPKGGPDLELEFADQAVGSRVLRNISGRLPAMLPWERLVPARWIRVPEALSDMPELGLGLDEQARERAAAAQLRIAARPSAIGMATREGVEFLAKEMTESEAPVVIFAGNAVIGHPGLSEEAAEALNSANVLYGSVEFGKQFGDQSLSRALNGRVLRVHAITELEMAAMSPTVALERFVRAVRERDVRFCYVRLFLDGRPDALATNLQYVSDLGTRLQAFGFTLGPAQPFGETSSPPWVLVAVSIGVVAGVLLLLGSLVRLRPIAWLALGVIGIGMALVGISVAPGMCRKLLALTAALAFPTLAIVRLHGLQSAERPTYLRGVVRALGACLVCAGITLCGACLIVGLLSDRLFMVKVDQFTGVKLALHLPLLAVGVIYLGGLFGSEPSWRGQWRLALTNWRSVLGMAVPYGHVLIVFVILAGAAVVLLRSGNEPGFGLSQMELTFRSALERILVVRPRQKEFLVGHPLLLLGIALIVFGNRRGVWAILACATIGQTSMVNTFCHIHTPLQISVIRTLNGLWVGAILGLVFVAVYGLGWRPLQRPESGSPDEAGPPADARRRARDRKRTRARD